MYLVCGEALFDVFTTPAGAQRNRLTLEAVPGGSPFNVAVASPGWERHQHCSLACPETTWVSNCGKCLRTKESIRAI